MTQPDCYNGSAQQQRYLDVLQRRFHIHLSAEPRECFRQLRGHSLHLDIHAPPGTSRGTLILVHGGGANGRLLAPFAPPFVAQGFEVWAPDLPGYGITRPASKVTLYDEWITLVAELAREASERGPVFLFGLSVGGMTALRAAQRVRGVTGVIASTLVDLRRAATFDQAGRAPWLGRVSRWLFRRVPRAAEGISLPLAWVAPLEKLSGDAELTRLLMRDSLIGKNPVSLGFLRSLHMYAEGEASYDLPCPLLLVHPGADAWTPLALSMPVFDAVRSPKQCVVLSNGSHAPLEQPAYAELCAALESFLIEHTPRAREPAQHAAE